MGKFPIDSISRRNFIKVNLSLATLFFASQCEPKKTKKIPVTIKNSFGSRGHQLWKNTQQAIPDQVINKEVIIIGGGVSGLSSAYHLHKKGIDDFLVLELASELGGNSISGKNQYSEYPYAAHYLTIPGNDNSPLLNFLTEKGIVTGYDKMNRPIFNEVDLCFDPEERLLIRGGFQDGLVPNYGLNDLEKKEILAFFSMIDKFKKMKGKDGRYFFNTPYSLCSTDEELDYLDQINFHDFLATNSWNSEYLNWYLDYCCKDDFGGSTKQVSAWAGINYFACHHGEPANTDSSRVLTWPEGNGRLVTLLKENINEENIKLNCLVNKVSLNQGKVEITYFDFALNKQVLVLSNKCVLAIPPFVVSKILNTNINYPFEKVKLLEHAPWMVATITLSKIPETRGIQLCWDNVVFKGTSLGYIYDQHQTLGNKSDKIVITLYFNFNDPDFKSTRKALYNYTESNWKNLVVNELEQMHNGVTDLIDNIEICVWGHGMIMPKKGLIKSGVLKELGKPINNQLYFAHTDLSGYSTFEEGFDLGYLASQEIIKE